MRKKNDVVNKINRHLKKQDKDSRLRVAERGYRIRLITKEQEDKLYNGRRYN